MISVEKLFIDQLYSYLFISMIINAILLFCLFSPNIVYFLHKKWFNWKNLGS